MRTLSINMVVYGTYTVNGKDKLNPNDKIVFEVIINDDININMDNVTYNYDWTIIDDMDERINTTTNSFITKYDNYLVIDASKDIHNVLQNNVEYIIQVSVSIVNENNITGFAYTTVELNNPPVNGSCIITSENNTIFALTTLVTVICEDWTDVDTPLNYQFEIDNGMYSMYCVYTKGCLIIFPK